MSSFVNFVKGKKKCKLCRELAKVDRRTDICNRCLDVVTGIVLEKEKNNRMLVVEGYPELNLYVRRVLKMREEMKQNK